MVGANLAQKLDARHRLPMAGSPRIQEKIRIKSEVRVNDVGSRKPRLSRGFGVFKSLCTKPISGHLAPVHVTSNYVLVVLSVEDISCLVIPDGCLGLPTLAALEQGIPVIAVRDNDNLMNNDLSLVPRQKGKFHTAENYLEAAGIMNAIMAGITVESITRPIHATNVKEDGIERDAPTMERVISA